MAQDASKSSDGKEQSKPAKPPPPPPRPAWAKPGVPPAQSNNPQATIANPAAVQSADKEPGESKPHDEGSGDARSANG